MLELIASLFEEHKVSIVFIAILCILLLLWTCLLCYLPYWLSIGQTGLSIIGALGAGLMVGAAFTAVIPESISDALENIGEMKTEEAEMNAYRLIGICITVGFAVMMFADALTHRCFAHSHSHGGHEHEHEHEHEHKHECDHKEKEHECDHREKDHKEECEHHESHKEDVGHRHSYQSTVWGLCFHSIFDGVAIGAAMLDKNPRVLWIIFFAIALHKSAAAFGLGAYFKKLELTMRECGCCSGA